MPKRHDGNCIIFCTHTKKKRFIQTYIASISSLWRCIFQTNRKHDLYIVYIYNPGIMIPSRWYSLLGANELDAPNENAKHSYKILVIQQPWGVQFHRKPLAYTNRYCQNSPSFPYIAFTKCPRSLDWAICFESVILRIHVILIYVLVRQSCDDIKTERP